MDRGRILDLASAAREAEAARRARRTVVLANGLFDLLHVGHLRYLEEARRLGDHLLVAVNADDSARRLRGPGRPVVPAAERAEMVAGLRCVDWVVIFEEDTVETVIRAVRPAIHAKGTDYSPDTVPEQRAVEECGGRIAITGDPKRHSSRDLIALIRRGPEPTGR